MLQFDAEGDGPLVVLLHGFPENRKTWRSQLPALARAGFRAVAPDLRGYGDSPKPPDVASYRLPLLVDDVAQLIEAEGGGPCILVGHDWGAFVAWFLAMTRPELVRKLVILSVPHPAAFAREVKRSRSQKLRALYQLAFALPVFPELFMRIFGGPLMRMAGTYTREEIATLKQGWRDSLTPMLHYYRAMPTTRGELRTMMRPILIPTLFIWGEREPVFIPATLNGWEEWVPDLRVERLPGIGHFIQHDAPERVSELLVEFARLSS